MDGVAAFTAVAGVGARDARQSTDAIGSLEVEPSSNAWRLGPLFLHVGIDVDEKLALALLVAL